MATKKTKRHSRSKSAHRRAIKSRTRSRSRSGKKGGFGGWSRTTLVGAPWVPAANNTPAALTAAAARSNHFAPSPRGVQVGGLHPAVPEMWGPGIHDTNTLVPKLHIGALGSGTGNTIRGGGLKNKRSKKGGYTFGGFPQVFSNALNNTLIGMKNIVNGFNGVHQQPSASGWNQPALMKGHTLPPPRPFDINAIRQAADQRVASV
jgi:hypothetical protein